MGYKTRQRATARTPVTREVIDRHNRHEGITYPDILAERRRQQVVREAAEAAEERRLQDQPLREERRRIA